MIIAGIIPIKKNYWEVIILLLNIPLTEIMKKLPKKISKINLKVVNELKLISILSNDSSEYFNKRIYPLVSEFEKNLESYCI